MTADTFRALVVAETEDGEFTRSIEQRTAADLPDGEILIRVEYSSLNYKDALSATGNKVVPRSHTGCPSSLQCTASKCRGTLARSANRTRPVRTWIVRPGSR